jgi:hypothetical protein
LRVLIARGDARGIGLALRREPLRGSGRFAVIVTIAHHAHTDVNALGEPDRVPIADPDAHPEPATHLRADARPDRRVDDPAGQARARDERARLQLDDRRVPGR